LKPKGVRRPLVGGGVERLGLSGSIATSTKPVSSSTNFVFVQVRPPSVVL
jgi:hypothetical protein